MNFAISVGTIQRSSIKHVVILNLVKIHEIFLHQQVKNKMSDQNTVNNLQDDRHADYKSCFARSVAVNSQYSTSKTTDPDQMNPDRCQENAQAFSRYRPEYTTLLRIKKNPRRMCLEDSRRYSCGAMTTIRQNPLYAQRISEIPIENMVHQNKIETLEWQLKEVEKSREMYRAVMKQVVTFLEKAHYNLESLENRKSGTVPRSRSEHQITLSSSCQEKQSGDNCHANCSWNVTRKQEDASDKKVIPPDKLSQEAFRLLRMSKSLLETREPQLSRTVSECGDSEFLAQLAKEFPATPEQQWPKRSTSFTHSAKLTSYIEEDVRISTAFNRKLSLQLAEVRNKNSDSGLLGPTAEGDTKGDRCNGHQSPDLTKLEMQEKTKQKSSPSISSGEDESGFSSLTSFQEIGLPLYNSTTTEEVSSRNAVLKSMLHNTTDSSRLSSPKSESFRTPKPKDPSITESYDQNNFWRVKSDSHHKRSLSTPVHQNSPKPTTKVLWV